MASTVHLPGGRLAGLTMDLMAKLRDGSRTLDELAAFLKEQNPFDQKKGFRLSGERRRMFDYVGTVMLPASREPIGPICFLRHRDSKSPKLTINQKFREFLWGLLVDGPYAVGEKKLPVRSYISLRLKKPATTEEIRRLLPEPHYSNLEDIDRLTLMQPQGEKGFLGACEWPEEPQFPNNIFYLMVGSGEVIELRMNYANGINSWNVYGATPEKPFDPIFRVHKAGDRIIYPI